MWILYELYDWQGAKEMDNKGLNARWKYYQTAPNSGYPTTKVENTPYVGHRETVDQGIV